MISSNITPADPRTWTDWSDPAAHGFVKVDCEIGLERVLNVGGVATGLIAAWMGWVAFADHAQHAGTWRSFDPAAFIGPLGVLGLAVILLGARYLTDNFYLVDTARHTIFYHAKFLSFRHVRLLLERNAIQAVATQTRRRRTRYRSWWEQRVVLIGATGRILPMSNWRRDSLWEVNNDAVALAQSLGCPSYPAPDESKLVVTVKDGAVSATHVAAGWIDSDDGGFAARAAFAVAVAALVAIAHFLGFIR